MKKVFEQITITDMKLRNRLVRSATWEGIANPDGSVTEEAYEIYPELARGGVGAIITGFTSVASNDFYFDGMMRLSDDALIPQYRNLVDVIHAEYRASKDLSTSPLTFWHIKIAGLLCIQRPGF